MKEIKGQTVPNILTKLAHLLGTEIKNRILEIPERYGTGYCAGYIFNEHIRMMISNYKLYDDIIVENPDVNLAGRMIVFKFKNIFQEANISSQQHPKTTPSVLIATSRVNTEAMIPIHTNTETINIEISTDYLNGIFDLSEKSTILQSLLQNTQPLLFEQIIYPSLHEIVNEIVTSKIDKTFELLLLRIKAEELICKLLIILERRDEKHLYPLNIHDIQTIYKIKELMLEHLEIPPIIKELAKKANMSPSKLKRLFKQIFGDSIFSYYQTFRIKEAARLLKEEQLSVSDVGYSLGFTNLSHFSRIFNTHIGMNPKKYSQS